MLAYIDAYYTGEFWLKQQQKLWSGYERNCDNVAIRLFFRPVSSKLAVSARECKKMPRHSPDSLCVPQKGANYKLISSDA